MGPVELTVSDLDRSLDYYRDAIGLGVREQGEGRASLGGDSELLVLHEQPGAQPAPRNTGLFHFALLVPERRDLAAWLAHSIREEVPLTGVSDHFVSEALYLRDPDEHGIEIYADRPREVWEGQVARMTTEPLDLQNLLRELDDPETEPFDDFLCRDRLVTRADPEAEVLLELPPAGARSMALDLFSKGTGLFDQREEVGAVI